ncbi:MAG: class I SAM-dependent methyltransferase [Synergistaceae bacterium]|nr:class I SAM-dependent methyltransferase [Synergistaceae bacterium]
MKPIDRMLQKWRMYKALQHIPAGSRLLDIGCFEGEFFIYAGGRLRGGLGIDPILTDSSSKTPCENVTLLKGFFPKDIPPGTEKFDVIAALAVLEHIPGEILQEFVAACHTWLNYNGLVILTIPSPFVDNILVVLSKLRLIDGMSLEEHHGLPVEGVSELFNKNSFTLLKYSTFQLGLNNLFVFQKKIR